MKRVVNPDRVLYIRKKNIGRTGAHFGDSHNPQGFIESGDRGHSDTGKLILVRID